VLHGPQLLSASRWLEVVLSAALLVAGACGGSDARPDASPPGPPDASAVLTIGDICISLTDVTCTRDAECFDFFDPPCDQSYYAFCCVDDGICDVVNGVTAQEVQVCISALQAATCEEIESSFPEDCVGITSRDGLPRIAHVDGWAVWGGFAQ
jgi:hypothetical protein